MYIYIYIIYWAPRAIYCVQAMKTAHLLITFSFSLPRETSKSQAGMRQLWVVLTHSHQDPEILHAIGGWYLAWDYLSIWTRAMVLMLPMWWNLSPEVWFSVLPLPANHVCGLRYWGWLMWQFWFGRVSHWIRKMGCQGLRGQSFPTVTNHVYP